MGDSGRNGKGLEALARALANGEISRRSALRRFGAIALGAAVAGPASLLSAESALGRCPSARRCNGTCCPKHSHCTPRGKCKCDAGYTKCDGKCVDFMTNPKHCGDCDTPCSSNNMATVICTNGVCDGTCADGFASCDGNIGTNGCEVDIQTDPDNCGGCSQVCSNNHVASRTCSNGSCDGTCEAGFVNCGDMQTDGCECAGTGCCGGFCQVQHDTGFTNEHWYDCTARDTYNLTEASQACLAHSPAATTCSSSATCGNGHVVCDAAPNTTGTCNCWQYDGTNLGRVSKSSSGCQCPASFDAQWH